MGFYSFRMPLRYSCGMGNTTDTGVTRERAGLCADCQHARRVESDRGSIFLSCERSRSDQRFAKYPRLPVLSCPGYEKSTERAKQT